MLKFIRGKGQQPSAERIKLQKELFAFRKTLHHGFPNKPTCLAWDPLLRIFAIGTASGTIKVLGKPGVEFYGHHASPDLPVTKLLFIPNQGRLISLCEDNSLHLWEINDNALEQINSHTLEGKLKRISAICMDGNNEHLLVGTEGGHIYLLNVPSFQLSETIIYQDAVMHNVPEGYKVNPGAVEALAIQPDKPENLLIGYNRGLMVLWNMKNPNAEQTYVSVQTVESVCWAGSSNFVSSHNDGSTTTWEVTSPDPVNNVTTYGPYSCRSITKMYVTHTPDQEKQEVRVFIGGLERHVYDDFHTISVLYGERHIVFVFTSKVIDFFVTTQESSLVLIALAEEELVGINLSEESWPMIHLPYMASLHASSVTCSTLVSNLPENVWNDIKAAGDLQTKAGYCDTAWPVDGGECKEDIGGRDVLLTGHEDGSVRIWDASSVSMTQMYKFSSSQIMTPDDLDEPPAEQYGSQWTFKKVGVFDPYSDDPRLAVKKITLCPETGTLAVAGTSGHVIIAQLSSETKQVEPKVTKMNIVGNQDGFVWKGHEALLVRKGPVDMDPGYTVSSILQLHPPACVTALALHSGWGLVAAGTAHGLALYDYMRVAPVCMKCTLAPGDSSGSGDAPISRRKSFKKSLRESFRRLRRGRSGRQRGNTTTAATTAASPPRQSPASPDGETKPVERAVEARSADDTLGSMVRCLTFSSTYIITVQNLIPSLWAGTNNGTVYVFTISIPAGAKRKDDSVTCQLGKEIQLKHRAPVISITVIDNHCSSVDMARSTDQLMAPHKVIITSEEQIKIFSLPALKPVCKLKLTAGEGARVRRTALAKFRAGNHSETCLICLTNLGDFIVLSLPDLRRQINAAVVRREDINGISSVVLSDEGEGLYLHSSSELERVTVSSAKVTTARCKLSLPPAARVITSHNDDSSSHSSASSNPSLNTNDVTSDRADKSEIRENGISDSASGHDVTLSSVGDITIDSVKDHLTNNVSNVEHESRTVTTEVAKNETTKHESTTESVVVNVVKTAVISTVNETTQQIVQNNTITTQSA